MSVKESVETRLAFDRAHKPASALWLAGVDEVGRGPWAGPVVAAAVILTETDGLEGLHDSKKISPRRREALFGILQRKAIIGIGVVWENMIDRINIYQATRVAMKQAVSNLRRSPDFILVDGTMRIDSSIPQRAVIGGDRKSASIAAASVIAKVCRDAWMKDLDAFYPGYAFADHKGYGTSKHRDALRRLGPCPVHRKSFFPVRNFFKETSGEIPHQEPESAAAGIGSQGRDGSLGLFEP